MGYRSAVAAGWHGPDSLIHSSKPRPIAGTTVDQRRQDLAVGGANNARSDVSFEAIAWELSDSAPVVAMLSNSR